MILYKNINELLTLKKAAQKSGRKIEESDLSIIKKAAILVEKGKISWVGKQTDIPTSLKKQIQKTVDVDGADVIPAFIDCHTHAVFGGNRAHEFELRNQGATYQEIAALGGGIKYTVQQTRRASEDELVAIGQKHIDRFIKQGVTTVEIKSGYGLNTQTEIKMLRAIQRLKKARVIATFLGAHAIPKEAKSSEDYFEQVLTKQFTQVVKHNLSRRADIFIEKGYFTLEQGKRYIDEVKKRGWDFTIHSEQLTRSGSIELAIKEGAKSVDHLAEASEEDIRNLGSSNVTAVLLPGADFYLKSKYPQARKLISSGARVALSTDYNPGSCPTQDISFIGVLARLEMGMTLPEVLTAFTLNPAYALGLESELGSIEPGKSADFVILSETWKELFYQVGRPVIKGVISKGRAI